MQTINASQARALFPRVVGEIRGAVLASGYAVLDMGPAAFGVMVGGEMVACCPTRELAHEAGKAEWHRRNAGIVHAGSWATCRCCDARVRKLEREGLTTSDAQAVALAEHGVRS